MQGKRGHGQLLANGLGRWRFPPLQNISQVITKVQRIGAAEKFFQVFSRMLLLRRATLAAIAFTNRAIWAAR